MDDKYLNDRLNYLLLVTKNKDYKLTSKEKKELARLKRRGFNIGVGSIKSYLDILVTKHYLTFKTIKISDDEYENKYSITDTGLKAIKYNHLPSESLREKYDNQLRLLKKWSLIIGIPGALLAIFISIKSCDSVTKDNNFKSHKNSELPSVSSQNSH